MKTTLKTFPKCCLDGQHFCERDAWKAELEAELRKEGGAMERQDKKERVSQETFGKYLKIREVLGDSE